MITKKGSTRLRKKSYERMTVEEFTSMGYSAERVDKRIPGTTLARDMFNCIDVLAVGHGVTRAVQCTSHGHVSDRIKKVEASPALSDMRKAGWSIEVWGWRRREDGTYYYKITDLS